MSNCKVCNSEPDPSLTVGSGPGNEYTYCSKECSRWDSLKSLLSDLTSAIDELTDTIKNGQ